LREDVTGLREEVKTSRVEAPPPADPRTKAMAPPPADSEDAERSAWEQKRADAPAQAAFDLIMRKSRNECTAAEQELRSKADSLVLIGMMYAARPQAPGIPGAPGAAPHPRSTKLWADFQDLARKALSTSVSGSGAELMPTALSTNVMESYRLERRLASLLYPVDMPTNPYEWPAGSITGLPYLIAENTGDTGEKVATRTPTTRKTTWTARRTGLRVPYSRDFSDGSVASVSDWLGREIPRVLSDGLEAALLNGDTAATHMDSRLVTTSNDCRKSMVGLRKLARSPSADTEEDLSTFTEANLPKLTRKMGKYGVRSGDLVYVTSPKVLSLIQGQTTNWPSYQSIDKIGPRAINVTGEVGALNGSPLVVSDLLPETCTNAAADTGGTAGSDALILVFNRTRYALGTYGPILVEAAYDIETLQYIIVGSMMADLQPWDDATTELCVSVGYNISVA